MAGEEHLRAADAMFDAGQYNKAAEGYRLAHAAGADQAAARYGMAISLAAQGQLSAAAEHLRAVLLLDPGHANAAYQLGLLAETTGDSDQAVRWYRQAAIWNQNHVQANRAIDRLTGTPAATPFPSSAPVNATTAAQTPPEPTRSAAPKDHPAEPTRRSLAEELGSKDFDTDQIQHGELLSARHGRLLRSYTAWLILPTAVFAAAYLSHTLIDSTPLGSFQPAFAQVQRVADSLSWPLLVCTVGLALLSWLVTIYSVYERRIDVLEGVVRRRQRTLWLYEVSRAPRYEQGLLELVTGTGTIIVESEALPARTRPRAAQAIGSLRLRSLAPTNELKQLTETLRTRQLYERRAMLDRFIGR